MDHWRARQISPSSALRCKQNLILSSSKCLARAATLLQQARKQHPLASISTWADCLELHPLRFGCLKRGVPLGSHSCCAMESSAPSFFSWVRAREDSEARSIQRTQIEFFAS